MNFPAFPETLYTIDIIFIGVIALFAVIGLLRGASKELASLITLFALLALICFYGHVLAQYVTQFIEQRLGEALSPMMIQVAVFALLIVGALLVSFLLGFLFQKGFKNLFGSFVDKVLGLFLGALRGALVGVAVMAALSFVPNESFYTMLSEQSVVGAWVCDDFAPWVYPRIKELPVFNQNEDVNAPSS